MLYMSPTLLSFPGAQRWAGPSIDAEKVMVQLLSQLCRGDLPTCKAMMPATRIYLSLP